MGIIIKATLTVFFWSLQHLGYLRACFYFFLSINNIFLVLSIFSDFFTESEYYQWDIYKDSGLFYILLNNDIWLEDSWSGWIQNVNSGSPVVYVPCGLKHPLSSLNFQLLYFLTGPLPFPTPTLSIPLADIVGQSAKDLGAF